MARILVVDDDEDLRELVAVVMGMDGHEVSQATDGVTGLDAARTGAPDLVVADWMMPGMTGLEMCAQLRARPELAEVPVLMLSARSAEEDIRAGLAAGVTAYMTKPFSPRELADRVRRLLGTPSPA